MESVIEKIFNKVFENGEEFTDKDGYLKKLKRVSEFSALIYDGLTKEQTETLNEIFYAFAKSDYEIGLANFKGGFKAGFGLALELLK